MIKVLINGINGRMGQEVLKQVNLSNDFEVSCGIDKFDNNLGFPTYTDISLIKETPDIIIDFSIPEASINILEFAKEKIEVLKIKTNELLALAKEKGTPVLENMAEEIRNKAVDVTKDVLKKLENK